MSLQRRAFWLIVMLALSAACARSEGQSSDRADALSGRRAGTASPALPTGQWLLDHALAHGQMVAQPSRDDAEYVLIWVEAAAALSPELPEAYLVQFDLLTRLDRHEQAMGALDQYLQLRPGDDPAALRWIELQVSGGQTVE